MTDLASCKEFKYFYNGKFSKFIKLNFIPYKPDKITCLQYYLLYCIHILQKQFVLNFILSPMITFNK